MRSIVAGLVDCIAAQLMQADHPLEGAHIRRLTVGRPVPVCKGAPGAKVSAAQVAEMRRRYAEGTPATVLAVEHNISERSAYNIVKGNTWKHVA